MFHKSHETSILAAVFFLACGTSDSGGLDRAGVDGAGGDRAGAAAEAADGPAAFPSSKAHVRFKGGERLQNDLSRALTLPLAEVCTELGQLQCVDRVHTVTLGGVDAYRSQILRPAPDTGATTPLAVDRVVLSACSRRSELDFQDPARAALWTGLSLDADGNLDLQRGGATDAIARLYRRALGREPTEREADALVELYAAVRSEQARAAARTWATLVCFAVFTTTESLFY